MTNQSSALLGYYELTFDQTDDHCNSAKKQMPHVEPPFITALKTGGTKEEAIFALERMWEEQCTLRAEVHGLRNTLDEIGCYAKKLRKSRDFVGPSEYHHDVKSMKVWQRALYHEGKAIEKMVRSVFPEDDCP